MRLAFPVLMLVLAPGAALAHGALLHEPPGWTLDPLIVAPLLVSLFLFGFGWLRLRRRSQGGAPQLVRRLWLFAVGWSLLAGAVVSPLHEAGERSFTAHMIEHEILMLVAAPLLVLSEPLAVMLWSAPADGRRGLGRLSRSPALRALWRRATEPVTATVLQAAALWLWHAPAAFDLALRSEPVHIAQHLSFLITALLFWSAVLHGRRRREGVGLAALCLFLTSLVTGALGAAMALAQSPWYRGYAALGLAPFGLTPAEDQQLAGLLMWIPGGMVHALAALVLVAQVLRLQKEAAHAPAA
jgi:cytochrome c oxidase assembly factor CtaG